MSAGSNGMDSGAVRNCSSRVRRRRSGQFPEFSNGSELGRRGGYYPSRLRQIQYLPDGSALLADLLLLYLSPCRSCTRSSKNKVPGSMRDDAGVGEGKLVEYNG